MTLTTKSLIGPTSSASETKITKTECERWKKIIIVSGNRINQTTGETAVMLAQYFDGGLSDLMTYGSGETIPADKRQRYFATAMELTESRISQMIKWGRKRNLTQLSDITERESRALEGAAHEPEKMIEAWDKRGDMKDARVELAKARGFPTPNRILPQDLRSAVREVMGSDPPTPSATADDWAKIKVWISKAYALVAKMRPKETELHTAMHQVNTMVHMRAPDSK